MSHTAVILSVKRDDNSMRRLNHKSSLSQGQNCYTKWGGLCFKNLKNLDRSSPYSVLPPPPPNRKNSWISNTRIQFPFGNLEVFARLNLLFTSKVYKMNEFCNIWNFESERLFCMIATSTVKDLNCCRLIIRRGSESRLS